MATSSDTNFTSQINFCHPENEHFTANTALESICKGSDPGGMEEKMSHGFVVKPRLQDKDERNGERKQVCDKAKSSLKNQKQTPKLSLRS